MYVHLAWNFLKFFFAITAAPRVSSFSRKNAKKVSSVEEAEQTCLRDNAVIEQWTFYLTDKEAQAFY